MKRYSFSRQKRLTSNRQFKAILDCKRRAGDGLLLLFVAKNECGCPRLGISVNKACGGSVIRNRVRRLVREAFRQSQDMIPCGYDYVVMVSPRLMKKPTSGDSVTTLFRQLGAGDVKASFLGLVENLLGKHSGDV